MGSPTWLVLVPVVAEFAFSHPHLAERGPDLIRKHPHLIPPGRGASVPGPTTGAGAALSSCRRSRRNMTNMNVPRLARVTHPRMRITLMMAKLYFPVLG